MKNILFTLLFINTNVFAALVTVSYDISLTQLQEGTFSTISSANRSSGLSNINVIQGMVTTTFDTSMPNNNLHPVVWTNTLDYLTPEITNYNYFYNDQFYARDRLVHYLERYESEDGFFSYQQINIGHTFSSSTNLSEYFSNATLNGDVFELSMLNRYYTGDIINVGNKNLWLGTATISSFIEETTTVVPAPPAIILMLSGLLGLFGVSSKK